MFNKIRRWLIERKLYCNESDYTFEEWRAMRLKYKRLGGHHDRWCVLVEDRTIES